MQKTFIFLLILTLVLPGCGKKKEIKKEHPHLPLKMTSLEYQQKLQELTNEGVELAPEIAQALVYGDRMMLWLQNVNNAINRKKAEGILGDSAGAIHLSAELNSTTDASGKEFMAIDNPFIYSPQLIKQALAKVDAVMPEQIKKILQNSGTVPEELLVSRDEFFMYASYINSIYQLAARIRLLSPYKDYLKLRSKQDVRGYHYLITSELNEEKIKKFKAMTADQKDKVRDALIGLCLNQGQERETCKKVIGLYESRDDLSFLYSIYLPFGKANWDSFFKIPKEGERKDLKWEGNVLKAPFNQTSIRFQDYLETNIEAGFKWKDFQIEINFGDFSEGPKLVFQKGAVPNVNKLGGNIITMDENESIEELSSQSTIRHEFGHVLGFPDCYIEFYDEQENAYVTYSLDTKDLMCNSASNKMNERMMKELERVYKPAPTESTVRI